MIDYGYPNPFTGARDRDGGVGAGNIASLASSQLSTEDQNRDWSCSEPGV